VLSISLDILLFLIISLKRQTMIETGFAIVSSAIKRCDKYKTFSLHTWSIQNKTTTRRTSRVKNEPLKAWQDTNSHTSQVSLVT
jgi:hypothetical protein